MPDRLYLDHAATTPATTAARAAMMEGLTQWANPSSPHAEGRAARAALEEARGRIAGAHGWTGEVLLTSGATESLAIALDRAVVARRLVSAVEHDAVLRVCPDAEVLPVGSDGVFNPPPEEEGGRPAQPGGGGGREARSTTAANPLRHAADAARHLPRRGRIEGDRALVCIQWANSETGVRQPIAAIAQAVHAAGHLLLVDAAQLPAVSADIAAHADFVALSAHKHGGPPGIGALLVRDLATLNPTGGQERGYRPGTENLPGALGWAAALAEPEPVERWAQLRARLDDAISRSGGEIVAADSPRHPAIGSYRMPGVASAAQLIRFDLAGIAVSAGSACSSGSLKPSHVLAALGYSEDAGREVVRISFGRETDEAEVERAITAWRDIARATRKFAA
ncbi:aminotransferase class V-fold PLP-dependent enzyme [Sphingomonas sp.]|uniref:aminotransferase class V-fold PLP-dependent enzyme n=1 Tax=Sphingomonas sp. TaxID=28214 RepID=UPI002D7FB3BD|nr:aminotransferase class V-fold PLP-dependent enzyme [Sphingomonas sp.]HEU0043575.1 aminotransferase class V-fold PLP-dependent enzyme [Sphingomonas sp.]